MLNLVETDSREGVVSIWDRSRSLATMQINCAVISKSVWYRLRSSASDRAMSAGAMSAVICRYATE